MYPQLIINNKYNLKIINYKAGLGVRFGNPNLQNMPHVTFSMIHVLFIYIL